MSGGEVAEQVIRPRGARSGGGGAAHHGPSGRFAWRDRSCRQESAGIGHHTDQADGEDLTDYLAENDVRVRYLHSDPLDRAHRDHPGPEVGRIRRAGGSEPVAEGLDLPEVSWWRSSMRTRKVFCGQVVNPNHRSCRPACGGVALLYVTT